jgi:NADP-dependent 3-hydroxy acid dehydrogenase YdfG
VATAARRKDRLDEVVADIAATGGTARSYALDVTDKSAVQSVVAAIIADFGRLDVLINNAGLMPIRPMAEVNTDEWDQMIDVNLKGTLYGIAAALPGFLEQGSGHIINLSSVAGIKVFAPGGTVYPAPSSPSARSARACATRWGKGPGHVNRAWSCRKRFEVHDLWRGRRDGAGLLQAGHPGGIGGACYRVRCRTT